MPESIDLGSERTIVKQNDLYTKYAQWWPLLSHPSEYIEEAAVYRQIIMEHSEVIPKTILELGSGGGNNAYHLKKHFKMTLVDLSKQMLMVSQALNKDCEHIRGDMRTLRLDRTFDVVFIHDAIDYMQNIDQLRNAITTAYIHLRPGGLALFVPDHTKETFVSSSAHGGNDSERKGLRYLEWVVDEDPNDCVYSTYMVYLLKNGNTIKGSRVDHHLWGLFPRKEWLSLMKAVGFKGKAIPFELSDFKNEKHYLFVGKRQKKAG
jgi:ubiquinone/menaquinone biosynthesis C-methylase UbiE